MFAATPTWIECRKRLMPWLLPVWLVWRAPNEGASAQGPIGGVWLPGSQSFDPAVLFT